VNGGRQQSSSLPRFASPPSAPAPATSLQNCRWKSQVGAALPGSMDTAACRLAGAQDEPHGGVRLLGSAWSTERSSSLPARGGRWPESTVGEQPAQSGRSSASADLGGRPAHARELCEQGSRAAGASGSGPGERRSGARGSSAGISRGLALAGIHRPLLPVPASHASAVPGRGRARPTLPAGRPLLETSDGAYPSGDLLTCAVGDIFLLFFKWGTEEDHCVARKYDLGFFAKCNWILGFHLPHRLNRWARLVRNCVNLLNKHNQCYLSQPYLKSGIYVSKNSKVVAS
jgi:hypothetical protein